MCLYLNIRHTAFTLVPRSIDPAAANNLVMNFGILNDSVSWRTMRGIGGQLSHELRLALSDIRVEHDN